MWATFRGKKMHRAPVLFVILAGFLVITAQAVNSTGKAAIPPEGQPQAVKPADFQLEDGTPIKLRLSRTVSSEDAQVNDKVDFDVLEDVKVGDIVVIPKGSLAWGTVTEAQSKRRMARGGKLDMNIDDVRLEDGEKAALRAVKEVKGGGHTGAMTAGIVATSLIVWPAAPFFLFMHGKDVTIPKGTEITAYVSGNLNLNPSKFAGNIANAAPPAPSGASNEAISTVEVKSVPDGADISVDGKFVGNTPSTARLVPGDHKVTIEKAGFKSWERTITLGPGATVTISPTLEHLPNPVTTQ
jgi:hypothetical protein